MANRVEKTRMGAHGYGSGSANTQVRKKWSYRVSEEKQGGRDEQNEAETEADSRGHGTDYGR